MFRCLQLPRHKDPVAEKLELVLETLENSFPQQSIGRLLLTLHR